MHERRISLPMLALIAGSRAALGIGIGLFLSERLGRAQRRAIAGTLVAVGVLTTVPLALEVLPRRTDRVIPPEARPRTEAALTAD